MVWSNRVMVWSNVLTLWSNIFSPNYLSISCEQMTLFLSD